MGSWTTNINQASVARYEMPSEQNVMHTFFFHHGIMLQYNEIHYFFFNVPCPENSMIIRR